MFSLGAQRGTLAPDDLLCLLPFFRSPTLATWCQPALAQPQVCGCPTY